MLDIIACALGWAIIACQAWSVKFHFDISTMPPGAKAVSLMVIGSAVLLTYLAISLPQPQIAQIVGVVMLLASLALFWRTIAETRKAKLLAVFTDGLPHGMVTSGPYSVVRHPFYTSYILHWTGWAVAVWNIWALVPVAAMLTAYFVAARDEEAKFAQTEFAEAYGAYKSRTGRFFPKLLR